jgi:hypothetical protein
MRFNPPRRLKEANITMAFYEWFIRNDIEGKYGVALYFEYPIRVYKGDGKRCHFDCIVYHKRSLEILILIEVKSHRRPGRDMSGTKQYKKYSSFGLPLLYITYLEGLDEYLNAAFLPLLKK